MEIAEVIVRMGRVTFLLICILTDGKIITDNIRENLNIESMDLAFIVFEKEKYYENGEHF